MQKKIFINQATLDKMSGEKKIDLAGNSMTVLSKERPVYTLSPAVKFISIESGAQDPHKLIGKIIPESAVKEKGMEVYMDSAIFKDEAYKVEQGFLGDLVSSALPPAAAKVEEKVKSDDELLADFFLKNL